MAVVDYRLLHRFRVSQRREMVARGTLPSLVLHDRARGASTDARPAVVPPRPALAHLVGEDR